MKLEAGSRGVKKQVKYRGGENDCQGVSLNVNFFLSYLCKGWIELMSQLNSTQNEFIEEPQLDFEFTRMETQAWSVKMSLNLHQKIGTCST